MLRIVYPEAAFRQGDIERAMLGAEATSKSVSSGAARGSPCGAGRNLRRMRRFGCIHKLTIDDVFLDCVPRCRLIVRAVSD